MHVIHVRNAHQGLPEVMYQLKVCGVERESRNGKVLKMPMPATILYDLPTERVVFWRERDANPFFHLLEAMWMLAGRNDVEFLRRILPSIAQFSDDGKVFHGAYGHRWRVHFGFDQLDEIVAGFRGNLDCRREVLQMWDCVDDLHVDSKDVPCNTQAYFAINAGQLDMMVTNRSNDSVWGALGANAVHFSILQEYMAARIGVPVGKYWQVTNNLHLYLSHHEALMDSMADLAFPSKRYHQMCPYQQEAVKETPLIPSGDVNRFERDMRFVIDNGSAVGITDPFVRKVVRPMLASIQAFKSHEGEAKYVEALRPVYDMDEMCDWRVAAEDWLNRRYLKWQEKQK